MPAISNYGIESEVFALQAREWRDTVGNSGMTPTAFSFLIPVFVVAIAAPFLCIFCIRKRRQAVPARPPPRTKKPALRRAEARERLAGVTDVSSVTNEPQSSQGDTNEPKPEVETRSVLEKECAICLSTLHAPAPPEPAKLSDSPVTDEAARLPSVPDTEPTEPETTLKLQVCGHEFHTECLVSWFVLRKTSCPICRAVYYSKEAMQQHDDEEAAAAAVAAGTPATVEAQTPAPAPPIRNWWYSLHGNNVTAQNQAPVELQNRPADGGQAEQQQQPQPQPQPRRTMWHRLTGGN